MALVIPENHYQALCPIRHTLLLRSAAITLGIRVEPGTENPVEVADDLLSAFSASWGDRMDPDCVVGPIQLTFDQGSARGSVSGNNVFNGFASGRDSTPPQVAVLVKKVTARVGRPGRGRLFMPWIVSRTEVDEIGGLTSSGLTAVQERFDDLIENMDTEREGMVPVILHEEGVPGGTTPSLITSFIVDGRTATQRRRNRGS